MRRKREKNESEGKANEENICVCMMVIRSLFGIIRINRRWSKIDIVMIIDERTRTSVYLFIIFFLLFVLLNQIGNVHGHFLNLGIIELFNIA